MHAGALQPEFSLDCLPANSTGMWAGAEATETPKNKWLGGK